MTGNWVIADSRDYFEHVVLCVERPDGAYDIFTGSFIKLYPVENCKSKIVEMSNPVLVGMTYSIRKVLMEESSVGEELPISRSPQ
jgi:hypothetical protein